jgi:prolipoprotein diacylglyceryltransferase
MRFCVEFVALPELVLARCARPKIRGRSTYTVLGFLGYAIASIVGGVLASAWDFSLAERLVALVGPPVAFIVVVTCATVLKGREWIVFYQATFGAVAAVVALGFAIDGRVWRLVDVAVLGIGVFLSFGRLGCFSVACCHGRPARRGVVYGAAHVAVGFWARWAGRPLFPVQLVESAGSFALVAAGMLASGTPGTAALVYGTGYAVLRFALELVRGDPVRPYAYGLSEAQWCCLATVALCASARPAAWTLGGLGLVLAGAIVLVARRRARELFQPPHLHELDTVCDAILADPAHGRRDTRLGVGASLHTLPDGRLDWVMSSTHPVWSATAARKIAAALWPDAEIIEGRTPGVVHVLVSPVQDLIRSALPPG